MSKTAEKQKIRDKYRGVSPDELETIPAIEEKNIFEDMFFLFVKITSGYAGRDVGFSFVKQNSLHML